MDSESSQSAILRMSDEKTLKLVDLYEKEQCLWNTHLEEYTQRSRRTEAAERIAKALNIQHFEAKHVMIKFKNLRNSYCQELKRISHSLDSATDDSVEVYKPRVFWFSKMDSFLRPHIQMVREPKRTGASCHIHQDEFNMKQPGLEDIEEWMQMTNPGSVQPADSAQYIDNSCSEHDDPPLEAQAPKRHSSTPAASARRNLKRARHEDDFEHKLVGHTLKELSSQIHVLVSRHNDQFESFGSYVASMLRALPLHDAMRLQPKIVDLITTSIFKATEGRITQSDAGKKNK